MACSVFERELETVRWRYGLEFAGYVLMPSTEERSSVSAALARATDL